MSYIDSYNHEFVWYLWYLPIYHPTENIIGVTDKWGEYDFNASSKNLVLWWWSWEHPALVLHRLECFVAKYINENLTEEEFESLDKKDKNYLFDLIYTDYWELLEFCWWEIENYHKFFNMWKLETFRNPCSEDKKTEDWLIESIWEFIFHFMPELNPKQKKLKELASKFKLYHYNNISCPPPWNFNYWGRKIENWKVKWGSNYWENKQNK